MALVIACSGRSAPPAERDYEERVDRIGGEMAALGFPIDRTRLAVDVKHPTEARADIDRQQDLLFRPSHFDGMYALLRVFQVAGGGSAAELRGAAVESISGTLQAYYQADRDAMVFLDTALGKLSDLDGLVAHELVHAWHDQNADLEGFMARNRSSLDRVNVGRCVMEGLAEAVSSALLLARGGRTLRDLDPAMLDASVARMVAGEHAVLPYHEGLRFMHARYVAGGWAAVRGALAAPPPSSEQLLHPEKLGRDLPTTLVGPDWPAGAPAADLVHEDTVGEMMILLLLLEQGQGRHAADFNATGWDGDRLQVWRVRGGGLALAWRTLWDREEDAHVFAEGFSAAAEVRHLRRGRVVDFAWAEDAAVAARLAEALAALPADFPLVADDVATTAAAEAAARREQDRGPLVARGRWVHPRYDLSLPIPTGWAVEDARGVPVLVGPGGLPLADHVMVTATPSLRGDGVGGVRAEVEKELSRIPSLELLRVESSTVAGGDALRVDYQGSFTSGGPRLRVAQVILPRPSIDISVSFIGRVETWSTSAAVAEAVLTGITTHIER